MKNNTPSRPPLSRDEDRCYGGGDNDPFWLVILFGIALIFLFAFLSCSKSVTQSAMTESTTTKTQIVRDTIERYRFVRDSVVIRDSVETKIFARGDTVFSEKIVIRWRERSHDRADAQRENKTRQDTLISTHQHSEKTKLKISSPGFGWKWILPLITIAGIIFYLIRHPTLFHILKKWLN